MQRQTCFSHILWDWNGTLLCDVAASLGSVNAMLARRGQKAMALAAYRNYLSTPIRGFYEAVFDLGKEAYDDILREYNAGYEARLADCSLTPGILQVLDFAREKRITQCIVSSCEQNLLWRSLKRFAIGGYFDAVLGAEDFLAGSKLERAKRYLAACGEEEKTPLVIGDLAQDAIMAAQLGVSCILLTSGHHGTEQFAAQMQKDTAQPLIAESAAEIITYLR